MRSFHADSENFDEEANLRYLSSMGDCELLVGANPDYKARVEELVQLVLDRLTA